MAAKSYRDFDLLVEHAGQGYRARVLNSPAGQAVADFTLPFTPQDLAALAEALRPLDEHSAQAARTFGVRLFDLLFGSDVQIAFHSSLEQAARDGMGLRVRLRLSDVPELADFSWELLYSTPLDRFLVLSSETPVVRYLDLLESIRALAVKPPLRVLAVIASPTDLPALDVEREWGNLNQALTDLLASGLLELERLEPPTFAALQQQLRQGEYHILHFVGHGVFDPQAQDGSLAFEDESQQMRRVISRDIGMALHDHRSLRLVVLNACEGAKTSTTNPFGGTAQALVRQGLPAVIAMQAAITDEAAIVFSHEFYSAMAAGYPVDGALGEARKMIKSQVNAVEWALPVLYLRAPDGRIFAIGQLSPEDRSRLQIAGLYREAQKGLEREDWKGAQERLQAALAIDPNNRDAAALLHQARQLQQTAELYAEGRRQYDAGHWREANEYFRRVQGIQTSYRDVEALVALVQQELSKQNILPANPLAAVDAATAQALEAHFKILVKALVDGKVIPFIGSGANLCGRPEGKAWTRGDYLPDGPELARHLARNFGYSEDQLMDLVRVSEYVSVLSGVGPLYQELHDLLDADYPPTPLHIFLATFPGLLRQKGYPPHYPIVVTTNYDDLLERAFKAAGEPYDLVTYLTEEENRGKFMHLPHQGEPRLIDSPNDYADLPIDRRAIIVKVHGAVDRKNAERDSFVITEDDYIEYLVRMDPANPVPKTLAARMRYSHFLFMGYGLRDWNLRVVLRRIRDRQTRSWKSWAVQRNPQSIDKEFWRAYDVETLDVTLDDYMAALRGRVEALPRARETK
ncbi:MAG: CHAT domain-containing protein [Anaerolineae bacterium]